MKATIVFLGIFLSLFTLQAQDDHGNHEHTSTSAVQVDDKKEANDHGAQGDNTFHSDNSGEIRVALNDFPSLHPLIVHFPIVLLLLAVVLQLIQLFVLKRNLDWVILLCAGVGFIGAYVAGVYVHPHTHELTDMATKVLEQHDKYADWTIWSSAVAAVLKLVSLFFWKQNRIFEIVVFVILAFSAYSVSQAGHYGSQLVHIEGVGPQGKFLEGQESEGSEHSH